MKAFLLFFLVLLLLAGNKAIAQTEPDSAEKALFKDLSWLVQSDSIQKEDERRIRDSISSRFWNSIHEIDSLVGRNKLRAIYTRFSRGSYSGNIEVLYDEIADTLISIEVMIWNDEFSTERILTHINLKNFQKFLIHHETLLSMDLSWIPPFLGNDATYVTELEATINDVYTRYRAKLNSNYRTGYPEKYWKLERDYALNLKGRIKYRVQFIKVLQDNCEECQSLD